MALEIIDRILTFAGAIKDVVDMLGKTKDAIPEEIRQKMPKWFGLTLDDERIFNALLAQLNEEEQVIIARFLFEKCKDYERNRFINIVAGMEVVAGKPETVESKFNADGKKTSEKKTAGSDDRDDRLKFLKSFAGVILDPNGFDGDLDKAYEFCVAGRMIIPNPLHQQALKVFSESVKQFKSLVLDPLGIDSLKAMIQNVGEKGAAGMDNLNAGVETLMDKARRWRDNV